MMGNILYIFLAILGLSILVFIHELGHYIMAKKVGMRIETFSIGFGKPIFSWRWNNVKWQLAMLPFGGFVKIAGMQKEGDLEPHEIPDGFFGKKPKDRIKVALMGPLVNLVFAFLVFSFIWGLGGRNKPFSEFTKKIGYVDTKSNLYQRNVRPGDEIVEYNNRKYTSFRDNVLYSSALNGKKIEIKGYKINYFNNIKVPFEYVLKTYLEKGVELSTIGVIAPASYLLFDQNENKDQYSVISDQIHDNDRILWVNGEIIFSTAHLKSILNESSVFLTILREGKIYHTTINLLKVSDLKIPVNFKNEIDDWRYLEKIKDNVNDLNIIPYSFDSKAIIKKPLIYIDETEYEFPNNRNMYNFPLKKGDKILAIGRTRIKGASELIKYFQDPKILMIVQNSPNILKNISYKKADQNFNDCLDINEINKIVSTIGTRNEIISTSSLRLLRPFKPITIQEMAEINPVFGENYIFQKERINKIKDPIERQETLKKFNEISQEKVLGINFTNKMVKYNPNPIKMFSDCFKEVFRTLIALISGYLNPKYLTGPIGIIQVVKQHLAFGYLEALYWLGFISLNLGILNLLPIPVLDGGHIIFSLVEMITRRPIKVKTMEKLIIPFVILLIGFFIFVTYNDILRIVKRFF
jgi:regulator of sigma E protease